MTEDYRTTSLFIRRHRAFIAVATLAFLRELFADRTGWIPKWQMLNVVDTSLSATTVPCLHVKENYFKIISVPCLRRRLTEIILFQRVQKLAWNCFKIISEAHCSSWIFSNMFILAEIISKLFQRFISDVTNRFTCDHCQWLHATVVDCVR